MKIINSVLNVFFDYSIFFSKLKLINLVYLSKILSLLTDGYNY